MGRRAWTTLRMVAIGILMLGTAGVGLTQQRLDENCTVSVLNRTVRVNPDGSWVLPNIPANFGQVKARATCVRNGLTTSGESAFFTVTANGAVNLPPIIIGSTSQIPVSLRMTPTSLSFTGVGQTSQLVVTATYPDNSTRDVTPAATGTDYTISNPAIATITANGLVTALASGTVVIQATNDGAAGMITANIVLPGADSDGDGISDADEIRLGLNPQNAVDAQEDFDRDGLTNLQEHLRGTELRNPDSDGDGLTDGDEVNRQTNPLLADTDGDGIPDGIEVQTASNPLDPNSFNLAGALRSITVTPSNLTLVVNTIVGVASRQLTVTGLLIDGRTTINLTSRSRGTNYTSSNLAVANFGGPDGLVFAGNDGTATITVTNNGFSATARVTVSSFAPTALSTIAIPGYANNVDVSGNFAYVAAGAAGLQVISISNRRSPVIAGSLDTPGNANDVRVVGSRAYIADGAAGLQIININNPANPVLTGSIDTPGDAQDVAISGTRAYIADGASGLQIIDVTNPATPVLLGTLDTPGTARGVDVSGNIAAVADGSPSSAVRIIDITNPASPQLVGNISIPGDAKDLVVRNTEAYVAAFTGGLQVVDFSTPTNPRIIGGLPGSSPAGFVPRDVELSGTFALAAEQLFPNAVPIVDITNPASPVFRAILNFAPLGDFAGTGIALDAQHVYMTGEFFVVGPEHGTTGNTRLFIGQYLALEDLAGIAPVVSITSPSAGLTVIEGTTLPITVQATDDVQVVSVDFLVNGTVVFTDSAAPYEFNLAVPVGATSLTLGATAVDLGDNIGTATGVTVNVIPDPLTNVNGRVVNESLTPLSGASVSVLGRTGLTGADGFFSIPNVPTIQGNLVVKATFIPQTGPVLIGESAPTQPVPGGVTNVGDIVARPQPTIAVVALSSSNRAAVIDLTTDSVRATLSTGSQPLGATITPDGRLGIISNFSGGTLSFIDLTANPPVVSGTLATSPAIPAPESVAITPNGRFGIVADGGSERDVIAIDLQQRSIISTVFGLPGNQAVAVTPDGALALVVSANTNQVSVLAIGANGSLTDTGQRVTLSGSAGGPRSIVITPNGRRALVTDSDNSLVTILGLTGGTVSNLGSIRNVGTSTSFNTSGLAITRDGTKVYVSNARDSNVAVLSIDANDNVTDTGRRIPVPNGTPATFFGVPGIAITPDGARLFISGFNTGRVSILDIATDTLLPVTIIVSSGPAGIGMPGPR